MLTQYMGAAVLMHLPGVTKDVATSITDYHQSSVEPEFSDYEYHAPTPSVHGSTGHKHSVHGGSTGHKHNSIPHYL